MQVESPAWEMNYWSPVVVRRMIDHDAARIGTACRMMLHFYPHYISWQGNTETPRIFGKRISARSTACSTSAIRAGPPA
jgi:hypothetical protein